MLEKNKNILYDVSAYLQEKKINKKWKQIAVSA